MNDDRGPSIRAGDVIAGKYRVERVLGRGAMGVVVAAMHLDLGELRAIKFMSAEALEEPGAAERFLREAKAASRLKSQYVARVYDVGRLFLTGDGANVVVDGGLLRSSDSLPLPKPAVEDSGSSRGSLPDGKGAPYIVMEYLEGADLRVRLKKEGPLSIDELVLYLVQACEAIGEAHAAGIVHRDLKPGNLFLTTGVGGAPVIKVFDFGIAKVAHGLSDGRDLTATAALLGTPKYMSPEQMRAERHGVDARSDIWALGVTIYNLLTRKLPFEGDSIASLCSAVMWEEPVPLSKHLPGLPAGIEAVVARCLAKDPAKRFQTTAELAEALLPLASEEVRRAAPRVLPPSAGTPLPAARLLSPVPPAAPADVVTGAPWAHATGTQQRHRSGWSAARVGGVVGLLTFGLTVAGIAIFTRIGRPPPGPAVTAVAAEAASPVPPPPLPEPSASATATAAPPPAVTPAFSASVAPASSVPVPVPGAADAGAPRLMGPAKPGGGQGKGHGPADPFWSSRR